MAALVTMRQKLIEAIRTVSSLRHNPLADSMADLRPRRSA
jgi:hypothetical protein